MKVVKKARFTDWIYVEVFNTTYPAWNDTFRTYAHANIRQEVYRRYGENLPFRLVEEDKPEKGKIYALVSGSKEKSIYNGNTWKESEISQEKRAELHI